MRLREDGAEERWGRTYTHIVLRPTLVLWSSMRAMRLHGPDHTDFILLEWLHKASNQMAINRPARRIAYAGLAFTSDQTVLHPQGKIMNYCPAL